MMRAMDDYLMVPKGAWDSWAHSCAQREGSRAAGLIGSMS
jgi:hypothetical protein